MTLTKEEHDKNPEKVDSTRDEALLHRVNYYYKNKDYIKFYENYRKLSEDTKNSKKQLLQKFDVDKKVKNYGEALISINKLISLSPNDIKLYENKISILEKFNDYEKIIKVYDDMLKIFPDNRKIQSKKSKLQKSRKRYRKSFNAF